MNQPSILITGASGYIGMRLAKKLLEETDYDLQLYLHASDQSELEQKRQSLSSCFAGQSKERKIQISGGELASENPFAGVEKSGLVQIVHSAAVTRFNVDEETANRINVHGSKQLLKFAASLSDLENVQFLSTVYASGLRSGNVKEEWLERAPAFSNHYERSKWEAEDLIYKHYRDLPLNLLRIATLIADDESGKVSQQNAFHNTLKLFFYGLLSLFPGDKNTPVYFVTGDFVLSSLMSVLRSKESSAVYHICHRAEETAKLEELLDTVFETFEQYADFKVRRVLKPLWSDVESFELLNQGISSLSAGVMSQAVSSVSPFARQLFAAKEFQNDRLQTVLPSYKAPDPFALIRNTAAYLASTKWGRQVQHAN